MTKFNIETGEAEWSQKLGEGEINSVAVFGGRLLASQGQRDFRVAPSLESMEDRAPSMTSESNLELADPPRYRDRCIWVV